MIKKSIAIILFLFISYAGIEFLKSSSKSCLLAQEEKLNVLLIVVDALRADHLGCYGYGRNTSPTIDRLAKEGVLFQEAFSQGATTRTSVPSLFTSLYPRVHQVLKLDAPLPKEFVTLPEILKKYGYTTAGFAGSPLRSFSNFINRFDSFDYYETHMKSREFPKEPLGKIKIKVTPWITKRVIAWLRKPRHKPFFLYLHYYDVHTPYVSPFPYNKIFWPGKIDEEFKDFVANSFNLSREGSSNKFTCDVNGVAFRYIISQYDGMIRYVDAHIKAILEELDRSGLSKNTLVILISDHGDSFLEHGVFFHGETLYDEVLRVPLIMRLDKKMPAHKSIHDLVRLIDIMPTILDVLGIKENIVMQGESLLPLIEGKRVSPRVSFSEGYFYKEGGGHIKGVRTEKWKFIQTYHFQTNAAAYELYDLENDPKELRNLIEEMPKEAEVFKTKLRAYELEGEKIRESILGKGYIEKPIVLDEKAKERFRSLGYLQ